MSASKKPVLQPFRGSVHANLCRKLDKKHTCNMLAEARKVLSVGPVGELDPNQSRLRLGALNCVEEG